MHEITVGAHFDIGQILTCGQMFRYVLLEDGGYEIIAYGRRLRIWQMGERVTFSCDCEAYDIIWKDYFDLKADYGVMKSVLTEADERIADYINLKPGIRILRQDPFEMVITFILSQNKSMPQIMQLVGRISEHYGTRLEDEYGTYVTFPTPEQLKDVTEDTFRVLKTGFRAPYLVDAVRRVNDESLNLDALQALPSAEARENLLQVKGIGRKVADCILLFGYHKMDVFPLDVWMKRAVTKLYFPDGRVSDKVMLAKAEEVYGNLAGLAQQYLFFGIIEETK